MTDISFDDVKGALPTIKLFADDDQIMFRPQAGDTECLPLPLLPRPVFEPIVQTHATYWCQHRYCAATVLLLDPHALRWHARIPAQYPMADGVTWWLTHDLFDDVPTGCLVAGSVQGTTATTAPELVALVPPVDGLHLVRLIIDDEVATFGFARMGSRIEPFLPEDVLFEDEDFGPGETEVFYE